MVRLIIVLWVNPEEILVWDNDIVMIKTYVQKLWYKRQVY